MRHTVLLLPLLALTACTTPREQCIGQATAEARINAALIAETEANIARGFGLRKEERVREVRALCKGETETGEAVVTRCEEVRVDSVNVPVAIDLNAERAKLRSLIERRDQLAAATAAKVSQCQALYPE